jgi:YD repeat-containing protein
LSPKPQIVIAWLGITLALLASTGRLRAQTQPIQYYYDDLGRLVTVVDSFGDVVAYVYDQVGNIVQIKRSTVTAGSLAIFDFNPKEGPIGTQVTIRGQGFSATSASDIVKFDGVKAAVTSASTTSLVATVPTGATTGPISVTVGTATATSSANFTVTKAPVVLSISPKSALFNTVVPIFQVTGANLTGATFFFNSGQLTISNLAVNSAGSLATMTVSVGTTPGTFALVASNSSGDSGEIPTAANRFTVVDPSSKAVSVCGLPDVVAAAYGLDPLNPNSCSTPNPVPVSGELDGQFSVLNTAASSNSPGATEAYAPMFSVLNTAATSGAPSTLTEADGIFFSVENNAQTTSAVKSVKNPLTLANGAKQTAGGTGSIGRKQASAPAAGPVKASSTREPEPADRNTKGENHVGKDRRLN